MGMKSFIDIAVEDILNRAIPLDKITIVVPSQRAIRYLQKSLAAQINQPIFAPVFYHIGSFVESLSSLQRTSTPFLLVKLFEAYQKSATTETVHSFERFLSWGPAVLRMFNDLDAHLAPTPTFFKDLSAYYRLQEWSQGDFNSSFIEEQNQLYEQLPALYTAYQQLLLEEGLAYMGLQYRQAIDALESYIQTNEQFHYFLGFNALNLAEQTLVRELINQDQATILWNLDRYFFHQQQHQAGRYIRQYQKEWPELRRKELPEFSDDFSAHKNIYSYGIPGNVAQLKAAAALVEQEGLDPSKTVLVIGDENYLVPLLSALPQTFEWNVTMGYPMAELPFVLFVQEWLQFVEQNTAEELPLKELFTLTNIPLFGMIYGEQWNSVELYLKESLQQNKGKIQRSAWMNQLAHLTDFQLLFSPVNHPAEALEKLRSWICHLSDQEHLGWDDLDRSTCLRLREVLETMAEQVFANYPIERISTLRLFYQMLMALERLDLVGSTEKGLQIMGVLETRLLDFENVIVTHVNEGTLPKRAEKTHPLIPFALQKAYGLPTFLDQDAVYTDHFYRLIQRAQKVFLFYNDQAEGLSPGEKSRFIYQLQFQGLPQHNFQERQLQFSNQLGPWELSTIEKDTTILDKLSTWTQKGISATALGTYLRDPLMFYQKWILSLDDHPITLGRMSPKHRGNILHLTLEKLYEPWVQKSLNPAALTQMLEIFPEVLAEQYQAEFKGDIHRTGYAYIDYELLQQQIKSYLLTEKDSLEKGMSIEILALEHKIDWSWEAPTLGPLRFKGYIDRLEKRNGQLTIVDYKSGRVEASALKLSSWEDLLQNNKKDKALQLLLYAWVLHKSEQWTDMVAGNIGFKNTKLTLLPFQLQVKRGDPSPTVLDTSLMKSFEEILFDLIREILDPKTPFQAR